MRDPATYRPARRNMARTLMRLLNADGGRHDWREVWRWRQSARAAEPRSRKNPAPPQ